MTHPSRRRGRSGVAGIRHRTAGRLPDHAGNGARTCGRCRRGAPHARGTDARRQPRQPARSRESRRRPCQCESPAPGAGQLRLARPQFVQWSVASHHHPPFLAAGTRPAPGVRLALRAPGDPFARPRMLVRLRSGAEEFGHVLRGLRREWDGERDAAQLHHWVSLLHGLALRAARR